MSKKLYIAKNCRVINRVRYERLFNHQFKYRFFFSSDDYDYVTNDELIHVLDAYFKKVQR